MPSLELYQEIIIIFSSFFAGFIDAVCGGGGLLIIPMLISFGLNEQLSIITHKFQAMLAMSCSFLTVFKHIEFKKIFYGGIASIIGGILGANLLLITPSEPLKPIILLSLVFIFIYSIFNSKLGNIKTTSKINEKLFYPLFGLLIGFYDGFLGPATGSFWIFASISLLGSDVKQSSINAKALCIFSGMSSLAVFVLSYEIYYSLGFKMAIFGILGAFCGARFILKYKSDKIKKVFLTVVFFTLLKLAYEYFMN